MEKGHLPSNVNPLRRTCPNSQEGPSQGVAKGPLSKEVIPRRPWSMSSGACSLVRDAGTPNGDPASSEGDSGVSPTKGAPRGGAAGEPAYLRAIQALCAPEQGAPPASLWSYSFHQNRLSCPGSGLVEEAGLCGGGGA